MIDPAWQGKVQFYELVFGTWTAYAFLVWIWERVLKMPLAEWKYVLITFLGASFFLINHYMGAASFWIWLISGYSVVFMVAYYKVAVRPVRHQTTTLWQTCAEFSSLLFTIAYISLEFVARMIVERGYSDFWVMLISYFGFLWLIWWRAQQGNDVVGRRVVKQHGS